MKIGRYQEQFIGVRLTIGVDVRREKCHYEPLKRRSPDQAYGQYPGLSENLKAAPSNIAPTLSTNLAILFGFQLGPFRVYLIAHPDYIRHVLQDNNKNYSKGRFYDGFKPVIGDGLLTAEGDAWRHHRRLANPSFRHSHIRGFVPMFAAQSWNLLEQWETHIIDEELHWTCPREMMRLTFGVVGQALFSMDLETEAREVGDFITIALAESSKRADMLVGIPLWLPTASNRRYRQALQVLNTSVLKIIQQRRKMSTHPDLLTMLIEAADEETGEGLTDPELRDEVMTFMLAGHETTANALTWTWYLLSEHPDAEAKVRAECRQVVGDRLPTFEDLDHLTYTKMVFQESLHLSAVPVYCPQHPRTRSDRRIRYSS